MLPDLLPPVQTWVENEELEQLTDSGPNSLGESGRLLSRHLVKQNRLKAGLTYGLEYTTRTKCPQASKIVTPEADSKFQMRVDKLIKLIKPPYFITTTIVFMTLIYLCGPPALKKWLAWSPDGWWREPWRLLTYGFIHNYAGHVANNALIALIIGWCLEREQGWARVAILWVTALAAGALGAGVLQPRERVVGASAAVYALLTAHLPNVVLRFDHIPLWWIRPICVFIIFGFEGCWALVHASEDGGGYEGVAWASHALGAAAGITVGHLVFTGEYISVTYVKVCRAVSALLIAGGVVQAVIYYATTSPSVHRPLVKIVISSLTLKN